ncbi:MAG: glycosyltransferase, partial [Planctomycetota bacterium]
GPRRGVARALLGLLAGLARLERPHPVRLLAPRPAGPGLPPLVGWVCPPRPVRSARAFRRWIPRLLREHGARVLLCPWSAFPAVDLPVAVTVHEVPFVRHGALEGWGRTWRHRRWLRRDARRAGAILVPSEATADDVRRATAVEAGRLHVVGNAFDPSPFEAAAREAGGTSRRGFVLVGTGGGRGRRGLLKKGVDVLLEAYRDLGRPDVALDLVGPVPGLRLPPGVRVHEDLDDAALARLVASARALVYPSRSEGFGYPPLEAMAAGVPVVAARAGSIPEVVGDAALLVEPGDPSSLARGLALVLGDDALRARLVAAGKARIEAFRPEEVARRVLDLLATLGGLA